MTKKDLERVNARLLVMISHYRALSLKEQENFRSTNFEILPSEIDDWERDAIQFYKDLDTTNIIEL